MKNKIITLILTMSLIAATVWQINGISGEETGSEDVIAYSFANDIPGNAYGTISVSTKSEGTYKLYWGDEYGYKLSYNGIEFSELGTCTTTAENLTATYQVPSPYTAVPQGATQLLLYNQEDETQVVTSYTLPEEKKLNEGDLLYPFALMSDVHYNRYPSGADYTVTDSSVEAFQNALKFVSEQDIIFVAMTGDLSANGEELAYKKFNDALAQYPNLTVYTCAGNHDDHGLAKFKTMINQQTKTDKNILERVNDGLDFIYEKNGDIFIFLSQTRWDYLKKTSHVLDDTQLNWLEKNLNKYADKKVYLLFHTYFASEDGDVTNAVGNLKNEGGYTYDLTYTFGCADEVRFRKLLNKYPNVTMFSGHSHWAYDQQKYNPNLNIGNIKKDNTGATLVHVSSVGAPRTIEESSSERDENDGVRSEGMVAIRFENSTLYMGADFKNGKYLAYATYLSTDGKKGIPIPEISVGEAKINTVGKVKKISQKSKKYKVTIKYAKASNAAKYQIQYSTNKNFNESLTKTKYSAKNQYIISKLKNKKTYYVRVRGYNYQFGYQIFGKWSNVKKIKINKKKKTKKKNKKRS